MQDQESKISGRRKEANGLIPPTPDEIRAFAGEFFGSAFPNPERQRCPTNELLRKNVFAGKRFDEDTRRHLLSCSECFLAHQQNLTLRRNISTAPASSARFWTAARVAGAMATLALIMVGALFLTNRTSAPRNEVASAVVAPRPKEGKPTVAPEVGIQARPLLIAKSMSIDLEGHSLQRGADDDPRSSIILPKGLLDLALRLPEGKRAGFYTLGFYNDRGRAIVKVKAYSKDGTILPARVDTRALTFAKRIRISNEIQAPLDYEVTVR